MNEEEKKKKMLVTEAETEFFLVTSSHVGKVFVVERVMDARHGLGEKKTFQSIFNSSNMAPRSCVSFTDVL